MIPLSNKINLLFIKTQHDVQITFKQDCGDDIFKRALIREKNIIRRIVAYYTVYGEFKIINCYASTCSKYL